MNEDHIKKVMELLLDWNPLGERAKEIPDLEGYETEAIDILFFINQTTTVDQINKLIVKILNEAFGLYIDPSDSKKYAEKIKEIINEK